MEQAQVLRAGPITLRRWSTDRDEQLDAAINESLPELQRFMPWATDDHGLEQTREYLERSVAEWDTGQTWNYGMLDGAGVVVGSCGLMTRMGPGVLEIGYWVHSAHTGRGYATAAATVLAEAGLRVPGIDRVVIKHDAANPASGRVAFRAGFTEVGREEVERQTSEQSGVMVIWERRA